MRMILGCALAVMIAGVGLADDKNSDKVDAKKLVGKWEPKAKKGGASAVIEFTKDGKLMVGISANGKETKFNGTYKVDGNKLMTKLSLNGKELSETQTITKLTDTELVTKDEKGMEDTLVRVKGK